MSVKVMALCWDVRFCSSSRKAVAVAIADHVDDQGEHAFPSVARLAEKTELSERTVQYALRDLEALGLLVITDQGGKGAKDTREWRFDMTLLRNLAERNCEIIDDKGADDAPIEGAIDAPMAPLRVQPLQGRVQLTTDKGATVAPEPSLTINNHPSAGARASDEARASPAPQQDRERLISSKDRDWRLWMKHLETFEGQRFARACEDEGQMIVFASKPYLGMRLPELPPKKPKALTEKSRQMSGEAA
jgi:DNA-binding transcriptional regulator YhcF (GntR family)